MSLGGGVFVDFDVFFGVFVGFVVLVIFFFGGGDGGYEETGSHRAGSETDERAKADSDSDEDGAENKSGIIGGESDGEEGCTKDVVTDTRGA